LNWAGDFAQKHIDPTDSVLDLGCGIMQATMNFISAYPKTKLQCGDLLGVDIHEPYLHFLREKGIEVLKHDLRDLPLPFPKKSFDVVLLFDVFEHLTLEQAAALESEASRIARKKVIAMTPAIFVDNEASASKPIPAYEEAAGRSLGLDKHQRHKCFITRGWLKERNYKVERVVLKPKVEAHWLGVKRLNLKILHVWDQAGVACLMALFQRKLGHQADIIKLGEYAAVDIESFYGFNLIPYKVVDDGFQRRVYGKIGSSKIRNFLRIIRRKIRSFFFYLKVGSKARNYDILHIHSSWFTVFFTPFKAKIIEFHGDDCRSNPSLYPWLKRLVTRWFIRFYSIFYTIYVSTPDLLRDVPNSEWLPNPVDPEHFRRRQEPEPNSALYMHNWYEDGSHAQEIAAKLGLKLTVFDRTFPACQWIPHPQFPAFLSKFEYFIDRKEIPSHSKTGLEALAMGLKVIRGWDDKIVQDLDPKHLPEIVAAKTIQIYRGKLH